jgi:hypothetical protein
MVNVRVLKNGKIYTGDEKRPWAQALAVVGERVVALDAEALGWAEAPGAEVEELTGATIIPGLTDAHIHFMWYAMGLQELDLRDLSREAFFAAVAERAAALPAGSWIRGRGWDQNLWPEGRYPTAEELDAVAPDHPVLLIARSAHAAVANSRALHLAGISAGTPDPEHGHFGRREDGAPNGLLFEYAIESVLDVVPEPEAAEVAEAMDVAQEHLLAVGLTGVHDVDAAPAFAAFQRLHAADRLRVRVTKYIELGRLDALLKAGIRSGLGDDRLRVGGLKIFADGALGARTAAMFEPYEGEPNNLGGFTIEPDHLREVARRAAAGGVALAIHAIGDRTNRLVLDVLEQVRPRDRALRHRIEHVQLLHPADVERFRALDVVASMQPLHATHDQPMADRYWGARAAHAYGWGALHDAGAPLAFGSDAPIDPFDPRLGLYAAVTRRHEQTGAPGAAGWYPEQRLSLQQALGAYTLGAAYAAGMESRLGLLKPGYLADLVVLDRNIFAQPSEALLETQIERVMVGGAWVWG